MKSPTKLTITIRASVDRIMLLFIIPLSRLELVTAFYPKRGRGYNLAMHAANISYHFPP